MKTVNGMTVYEGTDKCALDEYSAKMATEVPKLIKENKYNDEAIKKEITEIKNKNEFQDKDIENLQQKNIQLQTELEQTKTNLENYAIHGKSTGEYIHLTDSSETDCRVDVRGNSKQATREGYNELLQNRRTNTTTKGITVVYNEDGTIKASGAATDNTDIPLCGQWDSTVVQFVLKKGTHRLNLWTNVPTLFLVKGTSAKSLSNQKDLVLTEDYEVTNAFLRIAKGASINATIKPLLYLYEGQDKPYEQYGASPSLDYPSKIETVKGSVKVTSCNKNFFINTAKNVTRGGIDFIVNEDGSAVANGTSTGTFLDLGEILLKPGTYIFSGGPQNGESNKQRLSIYNIDNGSNNLLSALWGKNTYTTTFKEETKVKLTYVVQAGVTLKDEIVKPQIEKDTTATEYQVHKEDSVVLPIQEEMLEGDYLDKVNKKEIHGWEKKVLNGTEKWINTGNTKTEKTLHLGIGYANSELLSAKINCKCENLKVYTADYLWNNEVEGIAQSKSQIIIRISKEKATNAEEFKTFLAKNNITVYCKSVKRELICTQEQIQALEKLDKLKTYKNITNITTDSIAILDVDYKKDLETLLNQITKESEV